MPVSTRKPHHRSLRLCLAAVFSIAAAANAGPGAHGPGGEHLDAPTGAQAAGGLGRLPDGSVNVPKISQRRMGVRTALAVASDVAARTELPARVVVDPNASGRVQAVHGGRVEPGPRGLPVAGQAVQRGEVLAYVRHHAEPYALGSQQAQLADLRAQRSIADQRARRLSELEGTVPRKEVEAARTEALALAERERAIAASLTMREALVAPVSGVVARADAALGQVVDAKDVLFEIIDPGRMLVEATTADPALASRIASAVLSNAPDATLKLIGAARALRDGVLPLTFAAAARPGTALPLAIGQPLTLIVEMRERDRGCVLPTRAVVRSAANEPVVWIKLGAERFVARPVRHTALDANSVLVTHGLDPGTRVVIEGASLIAQIR